MQRRVAPALAALACLATCRGDPRGAPCKSDDDCGSGFDCFPDVCVPVCTASTECPADLTCYRYHCVPPGNASQPRAPQRAAPGAAATPTAAVDVPPTPDATIAELRAIRRELELVRRDQARITVALEKQGLLPPLAADGLRNPGGGRVVTPGSPPAMPLPPSAPHGSGLPPAPQAR